MLAAESQNVALVYNVVKLLNTFRILPGCQARRHHERPKMALGQIVTGVLGPRHYLFLLAIPVFHIGDMPPRDERSVRIDAHVCGPKQAWGYKGNFNLTKAIAYGLQVQIATTPPVTSTEVASSIFAGLSATSQSWAPMASTFSKVRSAAKTLPTEGLILFHAVWQ